MTPEQLSALAIAAGGVSDLASGYTGMKLGQARANYQRVAAGINRDFAFLQANDVRARGNKAAQDRLAVGRRLVGTQRAAYAGQGVDVSKGSAADVQVDTATQVALDANEIQASAWRQAWGLEAQGENDYNAAMTGAQATDFDAANTFATGGIRFADSAVRAAYFLDNSRAANGAQASAAQQQTAFRSARGGR